MKKMLIALALALGGPMWGNDSPEEIDYDKLSETFGHLVVRHLINPGLELNVEKIIQGIQNERLGKPSPMTEEEYDQAICAIQEKQFFQTAERNLKEATAFLASNAKKKGIKIVDSHLQYKIAQMGEGAEIAAKSTPLIHYKGSLIDGSIFASSEENEEPISLPLPQAIPGFAQGMLGMKEGEKRILYIHPELAYGVSGHLPPNSLLIFEVEVVKANTKPNEEIVQND